MSRWGRPHEEIVLDIAYSFGEGLDPIAHLQERHEREWTVEAPTETEGP